MTAGRSRPDLTAPRDTARCEPRTTHDQVIMTRTASTEAFSAVLGAFLLITSAPLTAQSVASVSAGGSTAKGLIIGASLNGSRITADEVSDESDSGGGLGRRYAWTWA